MATPGQGSFRIKYRPGKARAKPLVGGIQCPLWAPVSVNKGPFAPFCRRTPLISNSSERSAQARLRARTNPWIQHLRTVGNMAEARRTYQGGAALAEGGYSGAGYSNSGRQRRSRYLM